MSSIKQRILTGTAFYGAATLLTKAGSFLLLPVYTRALSPSEYGVLTAANVLAAILAIVLGLALNSALMRLYFEHRDDAQALRRLVSGLCWTVAVFASVSVGAMLLIGRVLPASAALAGVPWRPYLPVVLLSSGLAAWTPLAQAWLRARERARDFALLSVGLFAINTGATLWLVLVAKQGALGSLKGTLVAEACGLIASCWILRPSWPRPFPVTQVRGAMRYSLPLVPHLLSGWALKASDRLVLNPFVGAAQVGLYGLGYNLALLVPLLSNSLMGAWNPVVFDALKARETGDAAARARGEATIGRAITAMIAGFALLSLAIAMGAREIVALVAAPSYAGAARVVPPVALGHFLLAVYGCFSSLLLYAKKTRALAAITLFAASLNVLSNLILAPHFGIMAAAWNTALAYGASCVLTWRLAKREVALPIDWTRLAMLSAACVLVFVAGQWVQGPSLWASLGVKAGLWVGLAGAAVRAGWVRRGFGRTQPPGPLP